MLSFLAKEETEMQKANREHKNLRTAGGVESSILFLDLNNLFLPKSLLLSLLPKSLNHKFVKNVLDFL